MMMCVLSAVSCISSFVSTIYGFVVQQHRCRSRSRQWTPHISCKCIQETTVLERRTRIGKSESNERQTDVPFRGIDINKNIKYRQPYPLKQQRVTSESRNNTIYYFILLYFNYTHPCSIQYTQGFYSFSLVSLV